MCRSRSEHRPFGLAVLGLRRGPAVIGRAHGLEKVRLGGRGKAARALRELYLKRPALLLNGGAHSLIHKVEQLLFVRELDLGLGRVHVHVHRAAAQADVENAGGEAPGEQRVFIRLLDRRLQKRGLYVSAVAVKMLVAAVAAPRRGGGHEALDGHAPALCAAGQHS